MKAEIKVSAVIGGQQRQPILVAKIRTEYDLVISDNSFATIASAINRLRDSETAGIDGSHFAWELQRVLDVYRQGLESRDYFGQLESEWRPLTGAVTLDALKLLDSETSNLKSVRFEGSVDSNLRLILQSGVQTNEIPATRENLQRIQAEISAIKAEDAYKAGKIIDWINAVATLVGLGLAAWDRFDREREKKKENDERERKEAEKQRRDTEKQAKEPQETSAGGPAHDSAMDRIKRTC